MEMKEKKIPNDVQKITGAYSLGNQYHQTRNNTL